MDITPELLKSLKALANNEGATPAEREVALSKLTLLAAKAGIDLDKLDDEERTPHFWLGSLKSHEVLLADQVLFSILNTPQIKRGYIKKTPKRYLYFATHREALEFEVMFPYYLKEFRKSLRQYTIAFVMQNELHSNAPSEKESTLTPEEIASLIQMMRGIRKLARPSKQLQASND